MVIISFSCNICFFTGSLFALENWKLYKEDHWDRLDYRYTRTHHLESMPKERSCKIADSFSYYEGSQYKAYHEAKAYAQSDKDRRKLALLSNVYKQQGKRKASSKSKNYSSFLKGFRRIFLGKQSLSTDNSSLNKVDLKDKDKILGPKRPTVRQYCLSKMLGDVSKKSKC